MERMSSSTLTSCSLPSFLLRAADRVVTAAISRKILLGTAESCTGGMVATCLTAIPGSSCAVVGGIVSYACSVKKSLLDVNPKTLERFGAVSIECAAEMAKGACHTLACDVAVSITGIAGLGGGTSEKPVGTVCFAVQNISTVRTYCELFIGDRDSVRVQAVLFALTTLHEVIKTG